MMFLRSAQKVVLSAAVVTGAASVALGQEELFSQPDSGTPAWSSQDARNAGGLGWFSEAADNFAGQADWTITDMVWFGTYDTPQADPGNTQGFTIRFYDDDEGLPGTRLYEQDIDFADVTRTYLFDWFGTNAYYEYSAALPGTFDVPADGEYWVSIVALLDRGGGATEPQWFIGTAATVSEPPAASWFFDPGNFGSQNRDMAFTLNGTVGTDCPADLSSAANPGVPDGVLTGADFFEFLARFQAGDLSVDFSSAANPGVPDGVLTGADFFEFLNLFSAGC